MHSPREVIDVRSHLLRARGWQDRPEFDRLAHEPVALAGHQFQKTLDRLVAMKLIESSPHALREESRLSPDHGTAPVRRVKPRARPSSRGA